MSSSGFDADGSGGGAISPQEIYERLGGERGVAASAFAALVDAFYAGVEDDPTLRPMYPEADLSGARERLTLFLLQYFGGPPIYSSRRGHPRLRMRHIPFVIDSAARDTWLRHMNAALDSVPAFAPYADLMRTYFREAAHFLQNRPE